MATKNADLNFRVHYEDNRGRIVVGNSLTSFESTDHRRDVVLGASFAGGPTGVLPLRQGARAWIAHEGGPGKDEAGIAGLPISDRFDVPAAAIATMTARLSGGDTLLSGTISRVNDAAAPLGVKAGMTGEEAAHFMLNAREGEPRDVSGIIDESTILIKESDNGNIYSCWSFSRVKDKYPNDVFLVASHGAKLMALYALRIEPKGLIFGLDDSGIEGLFELDDHGIRAATVSTDSARIGDPASTYYGTISAVNKTAAVKGVKVGQSAQEAAELMLD